MLRRALSAILALVIAIGLATVPPIATGHASAAAGFGDPDHIVNATDIHSVSLSWADVPGASGYNVYRAPSGSGTYALLNASELTSAGYVDTGLEANTRYDYKVASVTDGTESDLSFASALTQPDFGPNVYVFDQSMPSADIQTTATSVFQIQEKNQFGSERYALLFKPGTYNNTVRVGFYTHVAGLGIKPDDVTINGGVTVDAEWWSDPKTPYNATQNFWRSAENMAIVPTGGSLKYAVSQAASMRRLHVKGDLTLHDRGGWASGGYLADTLVDGTVGSGSQQQWFNRNDDWTAWNGKNWNMVFVGAKNAPLDSDWPTSPFTSVTASPVIAEKPYLIYDDSEKQYKVFVPGVQYDVSGTSWRGKTDQEILNAGTSISIEDFYIAKPNDFDVDSVNAALRQGKHLLLTPGVYQLSKPIEVVNPNTVVFGLGLATLHANNAAIAMKVADVDGVKIAGLLFEAGAQYSPVLLEIGPKGSSASHAANPTGLYDLYFRVGGDALAMAETCIEINSNHVIGDHFWVWRADHGVGAGWDSNLSKNGLIVNGNDVTIYGLFVEHFHEYQTLWNGERGKMFFYQSEIPYDVPSQERWMSSGGAVNGYAAYKVAENVKEHQAYGLGVYSFFRDAAVKLESAIEIPDTPGVNVHHATSVFLSGTAGSEITHIVNNIGNAVRTSGKNERFGDYAPRTVQSIVPVNRSTLAGRAPVLPDYVTLTFTDATSKPVPVVWDSIDGAQYASPGSFTVEGTIGSSATKAVADVTVIRAPDVPVASIAVTGEGGVSAISVKSGTLQMAAQVAPADADDRTVTWSVVNPNGTATDKASIGADGLLTALSDGQVKVVATANDGTGVQGEAIVTISNQNVRAASIAVTGAGGMKAITAKGAALQMIADVLPANTLDKTVAWTIANETGQATISAAGLVTAKKNGTVKVTATANDGSGVKGETTLTISGQDMALGNGWSWVRENQDNWSIDFANPNVLRMVTQDGSWSQAANLPKGLLLRAPDTADFTISAKVNFNASANYEWAGLAVYQDDKNAVTLGLQASGSPAKKFIRFSQIKNGAQTDKDYADTTSVDGTIYLKIEKVGQVYNGYYSVDGSTWTQAADSFNIGLTDAKVGLFTRKLNVTAKTATFTNFELNGSVVPFWIPVSSVNVTGAGGETSISTREGTLQMSADVLPANANNKAVTWTVVNADGTPTDKASIASDGMLTAIKNGQVKVIATANDGTGVAGSMAVAISGQATLVESIAVTGAGGATMIGAKGGTLQLSADVLPANADDKMIVWSVANEDGTATDKATITTDGLLTAVKDGTVKAVASAQDASGATGELTITISGQTVIVPNPIPVTRIDISGGSAITAKGGTLALTAQVFPADATDRSVTWSVSNGTGRATIGSGTGIVQAVADGIVLVTATANDGSGVAGTATITISGQTESGCASDCGGSGTTPTTPPATELPKHQQEVTADDLKKAENGKTVVKLGEGKTEAVLPVSAAQSIDHGLEVKSGNVSLVVPPSVLRELAGASQASEAGARIVVRISENEGGAASDAGYRLDGAKYDLELILVGRNGQETKLKTFGEPVRIVLPYDRSAANADLLGIYYHDAANGTWQYIGGTVNAGQGTIEALTSHFSEYAVLEYAKSFADVSASHWAYHTLKALAAKHIVTGVTDTEFKPNGNTTRAEFVALLARALGLKATGATEKFRDVDGSKWYAQDIAAAYEAGLVAGVTDTAFAPNELVTREQMAILMVRAYAYANGEKSATGDHLAAFKDAKQVSPWAKAGVNEAVELGLMRGQSASSFVPKASASRAETAQAIYNLLPYLATP